MIKPKIIVFSLTKRGCVEYAESMVSLLPKAAIVISSFANFRTEKLKLAVSTYVNSVDFIIRTFVFVFSCYFLLKRLINENGKNLIFYFPVFHPWNLIISLYARFFKFRTIVTVHDFVQHAGEKNMVINWIQRQTLNVADQIVFLSQSELDKVSNHKWKLKSRVIPHPILQMFDDVPQRNYNLTPDVLFFGRISTYKGVDILMSAFGNLKNKIGKLTIAGKMLDQSIKIKMDQNINFINGYISEIKIKELLGSHHILVLPYIDASQSGVLTLGIDSCLPMIISDLPGLREQLDDSCAYWVKPGSSDDILKAIEWYSVKENYENVVENLKQFKAGQNQEIGKKLLSVLYES